MCAKKSDDEKIDDAVVHLMLSRVKPEVRSGVLRQLNDSDRRQVLNSELDGRKAAWERKTGKKWGGS
ncbi:hypothetical protein [Amycolatopsis sp. NPDC004625]|uniref:hypothetical protein n=1 Tax=Amycolatopsis sp. NPDC004625 TaxID=3154670 RepID=UPI0033BE44D3